MSAQVQLDVNTFHKRATALVAHWKAEKQDYANADSLLFLSGETDENHTYLKTTALQTYLLGYEFPGTLILFTDDHVYFLTSGKKAKMLEELKYHEGGLSVRVLSKTKDEAHNASLFEEIANAMTGSFDGKRVGVLPKDKFSGKFVDEWRAYVELNADKQPEQVDISPGLASIFAVKDEEELRIIKTAAYVSSRLMKYHFVEEMQSIIDEDKKIKHDKLAELTENVLFEDDLRKKLKLSDEVDAEFLDFCYTPIVQSGGKYDLKSSAVANSDYLHHGTIICSLGVRYKQYCSNIGRTYMVNPTKQQEKTYEFLLDLQRRVIDSLRNGVKASDVYNKAIAYIRSKRPDLESNFVKNVGFGIGLEFRESQYTLNPKTHRELKTGMVFNVVVGFSGLTKKDVSDEKSKTYALLLIDTVRINGDVPVVLTEDVRKSSDDVIYTIAESADEVAKPEKKKPKPASPPKKSAILQSKTRSEMQQDTSNSGEARRKLHQQELAAKKQQEGLDRFSGSSAVDVNGFKNKKVFRKFESYKRETALPKEVRDLRIVVDQKNESIILPIYGLAVPFHISTLKNVSKSDEGEYVYLRMNFVTPGQPTGKKEDQPFEDPTATFVRAITFRSSDTYRLSEIYKSITDLKKAAGRKEAARKEMADIVEQDRLVEVRGKRPPTLADVFVRPNLEGKRLPGELQIHQNGLRYVTLMQSDKKIDILFNNIRFLFMQPCDNELLVVLHVHLHNPVMIGKKKTKDVQLYREASDAAFDETGNRRRKYHYGDEDELQSEQEERRRRALLNKEFKVFAEKIAGASNDQVDVDIPFRDLGFHGVPFRTNVLLQPTATCLVHLSDPPFLVIPIADVEVAHLERVQFGLKNFDLVFVFKDFTRAPVHINTIPMTQLENVKEWLDTQDVVFSEGQVNLNWTAIMKTINDDSAAFFEDGGWSFLQGDGGDGDSDMSDSASEFELSGSDFDEESSEESAVGESESSSDDSDASSGEESSGTDWDEQDRKAEQHDEKKSIKRKEKAEEEYGEEDERRRRSKKVRR